MGCPWALQAKGLHRSPSGGRHPPASLPTPTQVHHDQLVPLGRKAWRGDCSDALGSLPTPSRWASQILLIKTNQGGGTRPRSRTSKNPGDHHPDQKPRKNQPMGNAHTNERGDP